MALENLHSFLDFLACCYADSYAETSFDKGIINKVVEPAEVPLAQPEVEEVDFQTLLDENFPKRPGMTAKRLERLKRGYEVKPMDMTEAQTRKAYIDVMLQDAGWERGVNWYDEYLSIICPINRAMARRIMCFLLMTVCRWLLLKLNVLV
mgnify:CR=1 FL=1